MIKIFGQLRYHWQPDLSLLIIYWSLSVIPIFIGFAFLFESSEVPYYWGLVYIDILRYMTTGF